MRMRHDAVFSLKTPCQDVRVVAGKIVYLWALLRLNELAAIVAEDLLTGALTPELAMAKLGAGNAADVVWKAFFAHTRNKDTFPGLMTPQLQLNVDADTLVPELGDRIWRCAELFDNCKDEVVGAGLRLAGAFWENLQVGGQWHKHLLWGSPCSWVSLDSWLPPASYNTLGM
jgi:hypothetical protein